MAPGRGGPCEVSTLAQLLIRPVSCTGKIKTPLHTFQPQRYQSAASKVNVLHCADFRSPARAAYLLRGFRASRCGFLLSKPSAEPFCPRPKLIADLFQFSALIRR